MKEVTEEQITLHIFEVHPHLNIPDIRETVKEVFAFIRNEVAAGQHVTINKFGNFKKRRHAHYSFAQKAMVESWQIDFDPQVDFIKQANETKTPQIPEA